MNSTFSLRIWCKFLETLKSTFLEYPLKHILYNYPEIEYIYDVDDHLPASARYLQHLVISHYIFSIYRRSSSGVNFPSELEALQRCTLYLYEGNVLRRIILYAHKI